MPRTPRCCCGRTSSGTAKATGSTSTTSPRWPPTTGVCGGRSPARSDGSRSSSRMSPRRRARCATSWTALRKRAASACGRGWASASAGTNCPTRSGEPDTRGGAVGQITTGTDADDFLRGANFMSASGGGDPVVERGQLHEDVRDGLDIGWRPLEDLQPDEILFSVCYSGSIAPESFDDPEERAQALGGGKVHERPFVEAVRLLEQELGVRCGGLVSIEIGGINSGAILSAAAWLELP